MTVLTAARLKPNPRSQQGPVPVYSDRRSGERWCFPAQSYTSKARRGFAGFSQMSPKGGLPWLLLEFRGEGFSLVLLEFRL